MMHALSEGRLVHTEIPLLKGKLAFIQSIDPNFVVQLCARYGYEAIKDIKPPISKDGIVSELQ